MGRCKNEWLKFTSIPNNPKKQWTSVSRGQICDSMRFQPLY